MIIWHNAFKEIPPKFIDKDDTILVMYVADAHLAKNWKNENDVSIYICSGAYNHNNNTYGLSDFHWNEPTGFYYVIAWALYDDVYKQIQYKDNHYQLLE